MCKTTDHIDMDLIYSLVLLFFCQSASGMSTYLHHSPKQLWWMFQLWSKAAIIAFMKPSCGLPLFSFMVYLKFLYGLLHQLFLLFLLFSANKCLPYTHHLCNRSIRKFLGSATWAGSLPVLFNFFPLLSTGHSFVFSICIQFQYYDAMLHDCLNHHCSEYMQPCFSRFPNFCFTLHHTVPLLWNFVPVLSTSVLSFITFAKVSTYFPCKCITLLTHLWKNLKAWPIFKSTYQQCMSGDTVIGHPWPTSLPSGVATGSDANLIFISFYISFSIVALISFSKFCSQHFLATFEFHPNRPAYLSRACITQCRMYTQ